MGGNGPQVTGIRRPYQALFPPVGADAAEVYPHGLLLQGRLGDGHAEHIAERQGLRGRVDFCSEQTADVCRGGEQGDPEVSAENERENRASEVPQYPGLTAIA